MNVTDRNENNKIGTIDCMGVGLWGSSCILCIWQELPEEWEVQRYDLQTERSLVYLSLVMATLNTEKGHM